jgi:transcriptional regulator with XRE-family HTH domain
VSDPRFELARRLRALREQRWPELTVTQKQLAEAFGEDERPLSLSLISSWESARNPVSPPMHRLNQYSIFFATRRSVAEPRARLLPERELTPDELGERSRIFAELSELRFPDSPAGPARLPLAAPGDEIGGGPLYFKDQKPITIICSRLPEEMRRSMPYTNPRDPDYVRSYTYADIDSLIELFGHVRAVNPTAVVNIRAADDLDEDDYTSHLLLLGGIDWNPVTRDIQQRLSLPVKLGDRPDSELYGGEFEVVVGDEAGKVIAPVLDTVGRQIILREDVGHVFRGRNPYNQARSVTLFSGMFGRGTYGAVRSLTDARFRDRNEQYLQKRFGRFASFSILVRVSINPSGAALTPDWTIPETRLHEWPSAEVE